ncbi:MAG: outer membrane protein [Hyphomicrobiaceae bacterium]
MRRMILALALAVSVSGTAAAADLGGAPPPLRDEPVYAGPGFTWTGLYAGVQIGGAWGGSSVNDGSGFTPSWDHDGWFGGGFVGFNFQTGPLVLGLEADWNAADISGGRGNVGFIGNTVSSSIDSFGSFRGRLGFAANRWLFFVTGGYSWADSNHAQFSPIVGFTGSAGKTLDGWTVGGGLEYAFSSNLVGRIEYRHYEWDGGRLAMPAPYTSRSLDLDLDTVTVGLSWKF